MHNVGRPVDRLRTRRETADFLSCTERHVDRLIHDGKLPTIRFGKSVRVWQSAIDSLLTSGRCA